jgi:hypothetical protein
MTDMFMPAASSSVASGSGGASAAGTATSGSNDFLAVLRALLPVVELDADVVATAVSEAPAAFTHLGEEGSDRDLLPADQHGPVLLARFIDPPVAEAEFRVPPPGGSEAVFVPAARIMTAPVDTDATAASDIGSLTEVETRDGARPNPLIDAAVDAVVDDAEAIVTSLEARREVGHAQRRGRDVPSPGSAVSAAARAAAAEGNGTMNVIASERLREDAPTPGSRANAAVPADSSELIDGLRGVGSTEAEASIRESGAARAASSRSDAASAASIQRVLDAVELLEKAPPPRHLTLELADGRLRVAIEDGQVRLSLLGERGEDASRFLDDARAALEERGFDLGGNRGSEHHDDPRDERSAPHARSRSASPRVTAGLRL